MTAFESVRSEAAKLSVTELRELLGVWTSGYCALLKRLQSVGAKSELRVTTPLCTLHVETRAANGARRTKVEPGEAVGRRRVAEARRGPAGKVPRRAGVDPRQRLGRGRSGIEPQDEPPAQVHPNERRMCREAL